MIDERIHTALSTLSYPVYQLVAEQDAALPLIAFGVQTECTQTKDGPGINTSILIVYCNSETITECVTMGNLVIEALKNNVAEKVIFKSRITEPQGEEGKVNDYLETIVFTIKHNEP